MSELVAGLVGSLIGAYLSWEVLRWQQRTSAKQAIVVALLQLGDAAYNSWNTSGGLSGNALEKLTNAINLNSVWLRRGQRQKLHQLFLRIINHPNDGHCPRWVQSCNTDQEQCLNLTEKMLHLLDSKFRSRYSPGYCAPVDRTIDPHSIQD